MNVIEVLLIAWSAGLVLERHGDTILVKGADRSTVPAELLACLREHKQSLLPVLTDQSPRETSA